MQATTYGNDVTLEAIQELREQGSRLLFRQRATRRALWELARGVEHGLESLPLEARRIMEGALAGALKRAETVLGP